MKIVILDGYTENPGDLSWEGFARLGALTVYDRTPAELIAERIGDAEIILVNKTPITRETLQRCSALKYIGVLATGYNVVDIDAAAQHGIVVTNIPTYGTASVAQMAIALLLEICHHVADHAQSVARGDWGSQSDFCYWNYPLIELAGKTMGIIGYGRIGQATGNIAQAMGMDVIVYDEYVDSDKKVSLDELYRRADVISLHCPLTPETQEMINSDSLAKMKHGVILINNARGQLIDEAALRTALESGQVYAAGLDVVSVEPIRADNPLLGAPNCFITPHISWAPIECRQRLMDIAVENLRMFLAGTPANQVN